MCHRPLPLFKDVFAPLLNPLSSLVFSCLHCCPQRNDFSPACVPVASRVEQQVLICVSGFSVNPDVEVSIIFNVYYTVSCLVGEILYVFDVV